MCCWKVHHLMGYSILLPLQPVATEILTCEKKSLSAFIHHATLFGHWKWFYRPPVLKGYISVNWNCCELTAWKTVTEWILRTTVRWLLNIARYYPLTAQYCAVLSAACSILRGTVHWLLNIAKYCPLTAQYCAVLSTDCSVLRSTVHWLLNIARSCPLAAQYCAVLFTDCSILRGTVHWLLNTGRYCPLTAQYCTVLRVN